MAVFSPTNVKYNNDKIYQDYSKIQRYLSLCLVYVAMLDVPYFLGEKIFVFQSNGHLSWLLTTQARQGYNMGFETVLKIRE